MQASTTARDLAKVRLPLLAVLLLVVLCLSAGVILQFRVPMPLCLWRIVLGLPCPLCGSTRSLAALGQLDWIRAFQFNPLIFLGAVGILGWGLLSVLRIIFGGVPLSGGVRGGFAYFRFLSASWWQRLPGSTRLYLIILLVLLNWIYLILA